MRRNLLIGVAVVVALVAAVAVISAGKDSKRADAPQVMAVEAGEHGSGAARSSKGQGQWPLAF